MKTFLLCLSFLFISASSDLCKQKDEFFILFQNKENIMFKDQDSSYYYTIKPDRGYWYGFKPSENSKIITKTDFYNTGKELKNIDWVRQLAISFPDSLRNKQNIFIIEEVDDKHFKLTHVKHFVAIE